MGRPKGGPGPGPADHEDQGHRPAGAQVLRLDWRLHGRLALHLPADVDHQGGVRRGRPIYSAPQVLLRALESHTEDAGRLANGARRELTRTSCVLALDAAVAHISPRSYQKAFFLGPGCPEICVAARSAQEKIERASSELLNKEGDV